MALTNPKAPVRLIDAAKITAAAQRALAHETSGLQALAASIDEQFLLAVQMIIDLPGRVVVTGVGKSGHVGNKIASTLASTGTPAFFVHPTDASHGDLGMITKQDAVLALSYGGESPELAALVQYTRRFAIGLIAMTKNGDSALGKAADICLRLPDIGEACPMGLAPTTSSTMMLAFGDALAIALLEQRGFRPDNFRDYHPGGALGKKLLRVQAVMHKGEAIPQVPRRATMQAVIVAMTSRPFGAIAVLNDDGTLAGVISDGDLRRHMSDDLLSRHAEDIMTTTPLTISAEMLLSEATQIISETRKQTLFVVQDNRPIGVISYLDCLRMGMA